MAASRPPWYEGKHQDALFYLLIAIFLLELITGGIAFFYGIIHASPEIPGGPPVAQFPWFAWIIAALLGPVALVLGVHLAGSWLYGAITHDEQSNEGIDADKVPESMRRFYAMVRHAPLVLLLIAILLIGATFYFVDGAFAALIGFGQALLPYLPWITVSVAALIAFCFLVHCYVAYRHRKMENEYAWRREVLEKTGIVITDKNSMVLPQAGELMASLPQPANHALPPGAIVEVKVMEADESQK